MALMVSAVEHGSLASVPTPGFLLWRQSGGFDFILEVSAIIILAYHGLVLYLFSTGVGNSQYMQDGMIDEALS